MVDKHLAGLGPFQVEKLGTYYNWQTGKLGWCSSEDRCLPDMAEGPELEAAEVDQENQELEPVTPAACTLGTVVLAEELSAGCSLLRDPDKPTIR